MRSSGRGGRRFLAALLATVACLAPVRAQEPGAAAAESPTFVVPLDPPAWAAFAAAQVGSGSGPASRLLILPSLTDEALFEWQAAAAHLQPAVARELNPKADPDRLHNIEDEERWPDPRRNPHEWASFKYLMGMAKDVPADVMARNARTDLSFAQLFTDPGKYRGQIVRVMGDLRELTRWDATHDLPNAGITEYYDAWIYDSYYNALIYAVLLHMPEGLELGPQQGKYVEVDGYLYKKLAYPSREVREGKTSNQWRLAPMLVAPTLRLARPPAAPSDDAWMDSQTVVIIVACLIGAPVALGIGLGIWFRRSDRALRQRINAVRDNQLVLPDPDSQPPLAMPVDLDDLANRLGNRDGGPSPN
jgi:hypothetical protein